MLLPFCTTVHYSLDHLEAFKSGLIMSTLGSFRKGQDVHP